MKGAFYYWRVIDNYFSGKKRLIRNIFYIRGLEKSSETSGWTPTHNKGRHIHLNVFKIVILKDYGSIPTTDVLHCNLGRTVFILLIVLPDLHRVNKLNQGGEVLLFHRGLVVDISNQGAVQQRFRLW